MEEKAFGNYAEYLEYIKTVLRQYEDWPEQERKLLEKDVVSIEKKLTDPNGKIITDCNISSFDIGDGFRPIRQVWFSLSRANRHFVSGKKVQ